MSKSKEELNKLKEEVESVNEKCRELTEEELEQVTGGVVHLGTTWVRITNNYPIE
ncbi:MAG: class IIb bacteriocin, lactobin A/cerein 7B family [Prevotellaceae bacterium]|nr:class IIb bacteriocin, lactobin A/cerein 7B family [Candidatus Colivivens equi]